MGDVDNRPPCKLPTDRPLTFADLLSIPADCRIDLPEGTSFAGSTEVRDKHGHVLEGDFDPRGHGGCDHRDTPEWRAEHPPIRRAAVKQAEWDAGTPDAGAPEEELPMSEAAHNEAPAAAPVTTESIGVDAAVAQVKTLVPADTSPALLIGGAAMLAVIGAAIKLGPGLLKARAEARERDHELQMKKIELEERKSEKSEDQHQQCSAARGALELRVSGVEKRLDEVAAEAKKAVASGPSFGGNFDPESIEDRLARLEKAAKAQKAAKPAARKR
jgi:hypothetical protein